MLSTEAEGRPSVNSAYSLRYTTRNRVTNHGQVEVEVKFHGGPDPSVEKGGDELWLVKFQSNSDIAGSHRNSFRASLRIV